MDRTKKLSGGKHPYFRHLYHRWLERIAARKSYPTKAKPGGYLVEITNVCNLRCKTCNTHKADRPKAHMPVDVFAKLIERIKAEGITTVGLHTVGEPFMHPDLEGILRVCKEEGITPALSTNAQFPDKIQDLWDKGLIYGLRFSIDGLALVYEQIRVGGRWAKIKAALEVVRDTNKGRHASRLPLTIDCVICKPNLTQVLSGQYLKYMSHYTFPHMVRFGVVNGLTPDQQAFEEMKSDGVRYVPAIPCAMIFNAIYFNNKGEATLCCRDYDDKLVIGLALDTPILDLWGSPEAYRLRDAHIAGRIAACNRCTKPWPGDVQNLNNQIRKRYYSCA